MRILNILFLLGIVIFQGCNASIKESENKDEIVSKLVILRTEGLAIAEYLNSKTQDPEVKEFCLYVKNYYKSTQKDFVKLCEGKELNVEEADFNEIWFTINDGNEVYDEFVEKRLMSVCKENLEISFDLFYQIMNSHTNHHIGGYSYKAMPQLYKTLKEIESLHDNPSMYASNRL